MTLILHKRLGEVVDPSGILDAKKVAEQTAKKHIGITTIEVPDEISDYYYDRFMQRLFYVLDGKIRIKDI